MMKPMDIGRLLAAGAVLWIGSLCQAQPHEMAKPAKEHELLAQFAGEWISKAESVPPPGQEPVKAEGKESARMIGGYWLVSEGNSSMMGTTVSSVMSLGYDPASKKYVGTFLCSMDSMLWKYEGSMDEAGKKLTLEAKGPSVVDPTKTANYRETLELKDKDHKVFESFMEGEGGKWTKIITVEYRRKK